jgi:hypothetical protein
MHAERYYDPTELERAGSRASDQEVAYETPSPPETAGDGRATEYRMPDPHTPESMRAAYLEVDLPLSADGGWQELMVDGPVGLNQ